MKVDWVKRACPLCQSQDDARVFVEANIDLEKLDAFAFASRKLPEYMHPRLIDCPQCGLLYGNPVLSHETLAGAYQSADFDSSDEAHWASRTYAQKVGRVPAPATGPGRGTRYRHRRRSLSGGIAASWLSECHRRGAFHRTGPGGQARNSSPDSAGIVPAGAIPPANATR